MKSINYIFYIIFILIFLFPLLLFGTPDLEDYLTSLFSLDILYSDNFFTDYYSLLGPGINFPLGQGHLLYPPAIFVNNIKIFFILTIFLNCFIQIFYFNRIIKLYSKKIKLYYFSSILVVLSLPNFTHLYFNDWISIFTSYTFYFPIIFYSIKFSIKIKIIDLIKLGFIFSLFTLNGHLSLVFLIAFFFIIPYFIFNRLFFILKNKYFYLIFFLSTIIIFDRIFYIYNDYLNYPNVEKIVQQGFAAKDIFINFLLPFLALIKYTNYFMTNNTDILNDFFNDRGIFYGPTVLFSFIYSLIYISFHKAKKINYINYIFILIFFISFLPSNYFPTVLGALWIVRDILFILSLIILFLFLNSSINNFYRSIIIIIAIFTNTILFLESSLFLKVNDNNNYLIQSESNKLFKTELLKLSKYNENYHRFYVGKKFYNVFFNSDTEYYKFISSAGIYSNKDFLKYNLAPFNFISKNSSDINLRELNLKMHMNVEPQYNELNDINFLSLYRIKYVFIFESEYKKLKNNNFKILFFKKFSDDSLFILENLNYKFINTFEENKKFYCNKIIKINCVNDYDFDLNENIIINIKHGNKFYIENKNNYKINVMLPFSYNKYWKTDNHIIKNIDNYFSYIIMKPNEKITISYLNYFDFLSKILSLLGILFFTILIILNKFLNLFND